MDELEKLGQTIANALGSAVTAHQVVLGELSITTTAADLIQVMRFLRDDEQCGRGHATCSSSSFGPSFSSAWRTSPTSWSASCGGCPRERITIWTSCGRAYG